MEMKRKREVTMPAQVKALLGLVRAHHAKLHRHHHWTGREPLITTLGDGARCVGARCLLEPALYGVLRDYLADLGLEARCCPEAELTQASAEGWELLHLQETFRGLEFVLGQGTVLCRKM
jgi:hypothetical protein